MSGTRLVAPAITPQLEAAFWERVEMGANEECWPWQGVTGPTGYGRVSYRVEGRPWTWIAHRLSYELLVGPIPAGLHLDHLCHDATVCQAGDECPHRRCVNPNHLEPVTIQENIRRAAVRKGTKNWNGLKTHCPAGHPYSEDNTAVWGGRRHCRRCNAMNALRYRRARAGGKEKDPNRGAVRRELVAFFLSYNPNDNTTTNEPAFAGSPNGRRGRPRQTQCKWGHPLAGPNVYVFEGGRQRRCQACRMGLPQMAEILDTTDLAFVVGSSPAAVSGIGVSRRAVEGSTRTAGRQGTSPTAGPQARSSSA